MSSIQYQRYGAMLALVIAAAVTFGFFANRSHNTSISIAETEDFLTISATFPDKATERVHDFVKSNLKMTDITDLKHLDVRRYETPDQKMRFSIESGTGFVKIKMSREENSAGAYKKLKQTAEGIKKVLAE